MDWSQSLNNRLNIRFSWMKRFTTRGILGGQIGTLLLCTLLARIVFAQVPTTSLEKTQEMGDLAEVYLTQWIGVSNPMDAPLENRLGTFLPEVSTDNTAVIGMALGVAIAPSFRFESELSYQRLLSRAQGSISSNDASNDTQLNASLYTNTARLMLNSYYDLHIDERCALHLMGGIGIAFTDSDRWFWQSSEAADLAQTRGQSSANFSWQLGIGQSIFLSKHWALDLSTRLVGIGDIQSEADDGETLPILGNDAKQFSLTTQEWLMGLRFRF